MSALNTIPRLPLLVVDPDPVFRLGLRIGLSRHADFYIAAEVSTGEDALQYLAETDAQPPAELDGANAEPASPSEISQSPLPSPIVLVSLDVGTGIGGEEPSEDLQGLELCQRLKAERPDRPVLVLGTHSEAVVIAAVQQIGADGYCPRQAELDVILAALRRIARGQTAWFVSAPGRPSLPPPPPERSPNLWYLWRQRLAQQGLTQINHALTSLHQTLEEGTTMGEMTRLLLEGQQRELRAAKWIVQRWVLPPALAERMPAEAPSPTEPPANPETAIAPVAATSLDLLPAALPPSDRTYRLDNSQDVQGILFDRILAKLQLPLINQSKRPLEVELLKSQKQQELLYLVLRRLENLLDELRFSRIELGQLPEKRSPLLLDLWQVVTTDFFGRYYTISLRDRDLELVGLLLEETDTVQTQILDRIPFVNDLLAHLLFQAPLWVDGVAYPVGNPAAIARAEIILDHLVLQVANAVVYPLLNQVANVEAIKQLFYSRRLMSFREIERFRNDLSWRYRLERYVTEPSNIFESQHCLFTLQGHHIRMVCIYAPRTEELDQLSGLPFAVTLALEARDAVAPRLRAAIAFVGSGVIYVLTEVVGRGIGLIVRGVLKGIGDAWQSDRLPPSNRKDSQSR